MKKAISVLIIATLIPFFSFFCSCTRSKEKTVIIADCIRIDEGSNLEAVAQSLIGNLLFSPLLYVYNSGTAIHYVLADEVKVLPGDRIIEVKLKDGVKFHDGWELSSSDIVNSIEREKKELKSSILQNIEAEAIDPLRFRLKSPFPVHDMKHLLSAVSAYPPSGALNGTGPFRFERWVEGGMELAANEGYFEGSPKLKRVVYHFEPDERKRLAFLLKGKADLLMGLSPDIAGFLKRDLKFRVMEDPVGLYTALFLNTKSPILADQSVRRAVSMAIDRDAVIDKGAMGGGVKITSPFPLELLPPGHRSEVQMFAPKEAAAILRKAGWRDIDGDGILEKGTRKLRLRLYYPEKYEELKRVADIISLHLFEAGIGVECAAISEKDIGGLSGDYDIILYGASYDEGANIKRWFSSFPVDINGNLSRYANGEMDRLLEELRNTADIEKKRDIYWRVAEVFEEDVPAAFLYGPVTYSAVNWSFKVPETSYSVYGVYRMKDWEREGG